MAATNTTCKSKTATAYAYRYNVSEPTNRYARVTMTVAACYNNTTKYLTSASCTVERSLMRSKTTFNGSMYKSTLYTHYSGKPNSGFQCDAAQSFN